LYKEIYTTKDVDTKTFNAKVTEGHLHTKVYIKRKSQSWFLEIHGLFSKLPIMYKGKLWKGLIYIVYT
jgi:HKD family nuclease